MIRIQINSKDRQIPEGTSMAQLIQMLDLGDQRIAVEVNEELVPRSTFEGYFLAQVFQNLFAGLPTDGPFGGGPSEDLFRGLLNDEYAKTIARSGGVGIADAVYREILKLQEVTSP